MLEAKLREAADKPNGLLFTSDFDEVTVMDLSDCYIADIAPIGELTHITELDLSGNLISDISPLRSLVNLTKLELENNPGITDITALEGLSKLNDLTLSGTSVSDWSAVSHVANVDNRPDDSALAEPNPPATVKVQRYHSVIPTRTYKTSPSVSALNDDADFLNFLEEGIVKNYLDSVTKKKGYQISFVTISDLEGYSTSDFEDGTFNAEYRMYNGFIKSPDFAHLTYNVKGSRWILTADGALLELLKNDSEVKNKFETDFDKGIVRGRGYDDLTDVLLRLVKSL